MSSDPRFLEAWVNRRDHRVFGRRLHPLCLLDLVALDAIRSPFVANEVPAETPIVDFLLAVQILSAPPPDSLEIDPAMIRPTFGMQWAAWRYRRRLAEQNDALRAYFEDYFCTLEMWRHEAPGKAIQAPWILAKVAFLLRHTNLSEARIWTAPVGQMLCYAAAIEEQVSDSQVISEEERDLMAELRRSQADSNPPEQSAVGTMASELIARTKSVAPAPTPPSHGQG